MELDIGEFFEKGNHQGREALNNRAWRSVQRQGAALINGRALFV